MSGKDSDDVSIEIPTLFLFLAVTLVIALFIVFVIFLINCIRNMMRQRGLTRKEVQYFFHGNPSPLNVTGEGINTFVQALPFPKEYQLPFSRIYTQEDKQLKLNFGEFGFGRVFYGIVTQENNERIPATIKFVQSNTDLITFKSILSHLKLTSYLGNHANLVSLLGAYTENIKKAEVVIAVEFCARGPLNGYLKKHQNSFRDIFAPAEYMPPFTQHPNVSNPSLSAFNLIDWAVQVATGMVYLGSKNVIHGDLALHNILLTAEGVVKISGCGLSGNPGTPSNAKIKEQGKNANAQVSPTEELEAGTPVPPSWRWMAVECLKGDQFSINSDVWAYGVTIWEIFSLGRTPYAYCDGFSDSGSASGSGSGADVESVLSWSDHELFMNRLIQGLRLKTPNFANLEIYNIMLDCWILKSTERPPFPLIITRLQNAKAELQNIITELNLKNSAI